MIALLIAAILGFLLGGPLGALLAPVALVSLTLVTAYVVGVAQ